jgi:V-type H+-transporting ATPase subunit E
MVLSDDDVKKQIDHMMAFIHQEAKEKADEIDSKAEEEFNIDKGRLVQQERLKVMSYYEKREKQIDLQRKIQRSNFLNQSRLQFLRTQDDHIQAVLDEARNKLGDVVNDKSRYKQVLLGLLTQCLFQLLEPVALIRCRNADLELVKEVRDDALKTYREKTKNDCDLQIDTNNFLPADCAGGIELTAKQGRIRVTNTLESRLELLSRQMLPEIRTTLFGANPARKFFE